MRVETTVDAATGQRHEHYIQEDGDFLVGVGPITGIITLDDGTAIDVNGGYACARSQEQADELAHKVSMHYVANGHPQDVDHLNDPDTPDNAPLVPVQRPFVYEAPDGELHVSEVGTPHGAHPLDEANGVFAIDGDPRIARVAHVAAKNQED